MIDTATMTPVAFATSRRGEDQQRWTELRLFYRTGERRPWLAESIGRTEVDGEVDRPRQRVEKTLEAAANAFDRSSIAEEVIAEAQAWLDAQGTCAEDDPAPALRSTAFDGAGGLLGALRWLYGDDKTDAGLSLDFERDWGVPARTVRHSIKQQADGSDLPSWCNAWLGALQHFDREAFHAQRRAA